jgi:chromatin remodeling complex protein RSC6
MNIAALPLPVTPLKAKRTKKTSETSEEKESPKQETVAPKKKKTKEPKEEKEEPKEEKEEPKEEPKVESSGDEKALASESETVEKVSIRDRLVELIAKQDNLVAEAKQDAKNFRKLLKDFDLEVKTLTKKKKRVQDPNKKPSGLQKPVQLSKELLKFLKTFCGVESNDPMSRSDVVKYLSSYIREHDMKHPTLRREIELHRDPNNELPKLFKPASYIDKKSPEKAPFYCDISIQRDIAHHFLKADE